MHRPHLLPQTLCSLRYWKKNAVRRNTDGYFPILHHKRPPRKTAGCNLPIRTNISDPFDRTHAHRTHHAPIVKKKHQRICSSIRIGDAKNTRWKTASTNQYHRFSWLSIGMNYSSTICEWCARVKLHAKKLYLYKHSTQLQIITIKRKLIAGQWIANRLARIALRPCSAYAQMHKTLWK